MPYNPQQQYDTQSLSRGIEQGSAGLQQGLRNYQANKLMAGQAIAKFEATVAADPSILQFLETDKAPSDISSAYSSLKKGGNVPFGKAAQLAQYVDTFTQQKQEAQQRQMKDAQMKQFLQQQTQDNAARQYGQGIGGGVLSPQMQNNPFFKVNAQAQAAGLARPTVDNILDFQAKEDARKATPALNVVAIRETGPNGEPIEVTYDKMTGKKIASGPLAPAPKTEINLGGDSYAQTVGTKTGEQHINEYQTAISAPDNIKKMDEVLSLLKAGNVTTGPGAEIMNNVNRVRSNFLGDKKAGKSVSDTQILDAMLGADVFPMISALGIGARGMDTPAERDFLRNSFTGTKELDSDAIKRLTEIRKNIQVRALERYKQNYDKGTYKKFFEITRNPVPDFTVPSTSTKESGGTSAADILSQFGIKP